MMDDVLFNQWGNLDGASNLIEFRPTRLIVQYLEDLGNSPPPSAL
jgi:hypothetical protein